jgi:hypothetical protein
VSAATPAGTNGPVGTPADAALVARVEAALQNLENCVNAGQYDIVIALHAPDALPVLFGTSDPAAAAALLEGFPSLETLVVENVQVLPDGRITAESTFTQGGEMMRSRDYWIDRDGWLWYAGYDVLPVTHSTPAP